MLLNFANPVDILYPGWKKMSTCLTCSAGMRIVGSPILIPVMRGVERNSSVGEEPHQQSRMTSAETVT